MKKQEAIVAMGTNVGNKKKFLKRAVNFLKSLKNTKVLEISRSFITKAEGFDGNEFYNSAIKIEIGYSALRLLYLLEKGERNAGRKKKNCYCNRTLDMDLIFFSLQKKKSPRLSLPHKLFLHRLFVLKPLLCFKDSRTTKRIKYGRILKKLLKEKQNGSH